MLDEGFTLDAAIAKVEKRMVSLNETFNRLVAALPPENPTKEVEE